MALNMTTYYMVNFLAQVAFFCYLVFKWIKSSSVRTIRDKDLTLAGGIFGFLFMVSVVFVGSALLREARLFFQWCSVQLWRSGSITFAQTDIVENIGFGLFYLLIIIVAFVGAHLLSMVMSDKINASKRKDSVL